MPERADTKYWTSLAERDASRSSVEDEFPQPLDPTATSVSRRGFLQAAGFSAVAATLASCARAPVEKAIPYLIKPEEVTPGRALWYASTCGGCSAACGVLVKNRDGRPIKLEGNPDHPLSRGGMCAAGQASVLGLYDSRRLKQPLLAGTPTTWADADREVAGRLAAVARDGAVRFLTATLPSPTERSMIGRFLARFPDARHVVYDAVSSSAILDAHLRTHGVRVLPRYRVERAEVIASFDADFLGTWISPVEYAAGWRSGRDLESRPPRCSYHAQLESRLSLSGAKADRRVRAAPHEVGPALERLTVALARVAGVAFRSGDGKVGAEVAAIVDDLALRLWQARGRSLVVCGSQDTDVQVLANLANHLLGSYGATLDIERPSLQRQGSDGDLATLLTELAAGRVAALLVAGCNPVFDLPGGAALAHALGKVPLVVSLAPRLDETARCAGIVCPVGHQLEEWGDAEPVAGVFSLRQPAIEPLGDTRPLVESLALWSGEPRGALELVREHWRSDVFPHQGGEREFEAFWDAAVQRGAVEITPAPSRAGAFRPGSARPLPPSPRPTGLTAVLHAAIAMPTAEHAYNAWLHELPDPVTKVTWDNVAGLSPATAHRLGVAEGDVVRVEADGVALELPAYVQPGQHDDVVAIALGYGAEASRRFADIGPQWLEAGPSVGENGLVGTNAAPLLALADGTLRYERSGVRLSRTGRRRALACTQSHHTLTVPDRLAPGGTDRRPIVEETTVRALAAGPADRLETPEEVKHDLWPEDHPTPGHRWAMVVDLAACTGCSACVVACQVENNIPVVGRDEVRRRRAMHWLRIDRYFSGDEGEVDVAFEPMMCQHCGHAPCETVCPVLATVHSQEGLNQQVYNRCIGTRYCANNCPYKARRFNWFNYAHSDRLADLVLNPDVTVRTRGVMEKCTFCVQRIEEAKIEAKRTGTQVADGVIRPACQQSCPVGAITFGDLNDPTSAVSRAMANPRRFRVLDELNVRPSAGYLAVSRNREEGGYERV